MLKLNVLYNAFCARIMLNGRFSSVCFAMLI